MVSGESVDMSQMPLAKAVPIPNLKVPTHHS